MKDANNQQLQNVTFMNIVSEVLGLQEEEKHEPTINESNGAARMQEIMMGQIVSESDGDNSEPSPDEAGQDKSSNKPTVWQENHSKIQLALLQSIKGKGKLPSKSELARYTGLSRVCITEHLKDDTTLDLYKVEINKVRMLSSVLLSKLTELALQGELKALKMLLDLIGDKQSTSTTAQSNFIQVNNTRIDNMVVEQLSPDATKKIEKIIKAELEK